MSCCGKVLVARIGLTDLKFLKVIRRSKLSFLCKYGCNHVSDVTITTMLVDGFDTHANVE